MILKNEHGYLHKAAHFLRGRLETPPVAWIPHPDRIESADEVLALARDIKAFVETIGARAVEIITSLPFHALPLLGALLSPHVLGRVTFLELDRNAAAVGDEYVPLRLP